MSNQDSQRQVRHPPGGLFAGVLGAFLGLALLKFGNPPIVEKLVTAPENAYEFVIGTMWPVRWGYWMLLALCLLGFRAANWRVSCSRWLAFLPLAWFCWQLLAATETIDPALSGPTLAHLAATTACFYLGLVILAQARNMVPFWITLGAAFAVVMAVGWMQQFGGLQKTREYFFAYIYPGLKEVSPEYLKKINSDRIFATLFYPNSLAGVILLLLPPLLAFTWSLRDWFTFGARSFLAGVLTVSALCCLYWSGSKGGALLLLVCGVVALLRLRFSPHLKLALVVAIAITGLAGFAWKYASYFKKGATSVGARFDYWNAAVRTFGEHPFFGTGPGTFGIAYQRLKRPESEPARLAHNDYLEQASDSGAPGCVLYLAAIAGTLAWSFKRIAAQDSQGFGVWLGLLAWSLQGFIEFGLYIPALSWPAFTLMGWLIGTRIPIDKPKVQP